MVRGIKGTIHVQSVGDFHPRGNMIPWCCVFVGRFITMKFLDARRHLMRYSLTVAYYSHFTFSLSHLHCFSCILYRIQIYMYCQVIHRRSLNDRTNPNPFRNDRSSRHEIVFIAHYIKFRFDSCRDLQRSVIMPQVSQ